MKKIKRFFGFILLILCVCAGALICSGHGKYKSALEQKSLSDAVEELRAAENYTAIDMIPEFYRQAVVAVEDRRFYYHPGIDPIGIARAVITDIKERELVEGGSSITQQLAKNMYFVGDFTPSRKIAEIFLAFDIEKNYSKDEILELYFNGIYYGKGCYNIYDAAKEYFGKTPSEMTPSECALLAGIPNAPSVYSTNAELAEKRRRKVVETMAECRYITAEEAEILKSE